MTRYRQKKIVEAEQRRPWRVGDLEAFFDAPSATSTTGDWIVTLDEARGVRVVIPDATFRELYEPVVDRNDEPEEARRPWRPEDWVETVAMPLWLDESGNYLTATCPFCGTRNRTPFYAACAHYRKFHEQDSRIYAVFEGTPTGGTHTWIVPRELVAIIAGGPDWFVVRKYNGEQRMAHRNSLFRIPYVDGIILSSRGDPLGDKE